MLWLVMALALSSKLANGPDGFRCCRDVEDTVTWLIHGGSGWPRNTIQKTWLLTFSGLQGTNLLRWFCYFLHSFSMFYSCLFTFWNLGASRLIDIEDKVRGSHGQPKGASRCSRFSRKAASLRSLLSILVNPALDKHLTCKALPGNV